MEGYFPPASLIRLYNPIPDIYYHILNTLTVPRYAKKHASHEVNLNQYGAGLSEFVKEAPFAADLPYLPDFTEFCYIWQQVYLQGGEAVLLESDYPVYEIWERCQPEFKGEQNIANWQGPFRYVLYRENDKVQIMTAPAIA